MIIILAAILIIGIAVYAGTTNLANTQDQNPAGEAARPIKPKPVLLYDCSDSDNGKNPNIAGKTELTNTKRQEVSSASDTCQSSSAVKEYYCKAPRVSSISSEIINCATGYRCKTEDRACTNLPPKAEIQVPASITLTSTSSPTTLIPVTVTGYDDLEVKKLLLFNKSNEQIADYACTGKQTSCSATFYPEVPSNNGAKYEFSGRAVDSAGQLSSPASGSGEVIVDVDLPPTIEVTQPPPATTKPFISFTIKGNDDKDVAQLKAYTKHNEELRSIECEGIQTSCEAIFENIPLDLWELDPSILVAAVDSSGQLSEKIILKGFFSPIKNEKTPVKKGDVFYIRTSNDPLHNLYRIIYDGIDSTIAKGTVKTSSPYAHFTEVSSSKPYETFDVRVFPVGYFNTTDNQQNVVINSGVWGDFIYPLPMSASHVFTNANPIAEGQEDYDIFMDFDNDLVIESNGQSK